MKAEVPARAGLVGHPSDGFGGATLAVTIKNFAAEVRAQPAPALDIAPDGDGQWPEGGLPLVSAAVECFAAHSAAIGAAFDASVRIRYRSTIPRQVGLGGSSAIVIATMRALATLNGVQLDSRRLSELALSAETDRLGITAGLQDRVVQTYGGLVFMDLAMRSYEPLPPDLLPPLFVAWRPDAGTASGATHSGVRARFEAGEPRIVGAMDTLGSLARGARAALDAHDHAAFAAAVDAGYDVRASIYDLDPRHTAMIDRARALGLSATYTGSGGAIVGVLPDPDALPALARTLVADGVCVEAALA